LSCKKVHADEKIDQEMKEMVEADMKVDRSKPNFVKIPGENKEGCDQNREVTDPKEKFVEFLDNLILGLLN
jgi:hypothetical protein